MKLTKTKMELELGFKITKTIDDYSSGDLRISMDRTSPLFVFKETDTMFVLTAHLKGYKKERIQIEVNQDGNRIAIIGERTVQEMVMLNWQMHRKEPERRGFRKVFNIPQGVNLDKIKARFNEDESCLTISMPKLVKGFLGLKIEEKSEEHEQSLQKENENLAKENDKSVTEVSAMKEIEHREQVVDQDNIVGDEIPQMENKIQELESESLQETSNIHQKQKGKKLKGKDFAGRKGEKGESSVQQQANEGIENREQVASEAKSIVGDNISQAERKIQGLESDSLQETSIVDQERKGKKLDGNDFAERKGEKGDNSVKQQANEEIENREQAVAEAKSNAGEKILQAAESETQGLRSHSLEKTRIVDQERKGKKTEGKDFSERKDADGENSVEKEANEVIQSNEQESEIQPKEKESRLCVPIIAGTAFIMSVVIVFVMHMVRANSAPSKKKN